MIKLIKKIFDEYERIVRRLSQATNESEMEQLELELMVKILTPMLIVAVIVNYILGIIWKLPIVDTSIFSIVLLVAIYLTQVGIKSDLPLQVKSWIINLCYLIAIFATFTIYYSLIHDMIWFVVFIIHILFALNSNTLFIKSLSILYVFMYTISSMMSENTVVVIDKTYQVIQFTLLLFIIISSFIGNYVYKKIISSKNDYFKEVVEQKEEITSLYEEIVASEESLLAQNSQLNQLNEEIVANKEKLEVLAYKDTLTSLPNRKMLIEQLELLIDKSIAMNENFAVVFIDIDNFKRVNDSLGHHAGDILLVKVTERLNLLCDEKDLLGRLGGDEFALLIRRNLSGNLILKYVQMLCDNINESIELYDNVKIKVTASFGISVFPTDGENVHDLLRAADTAMYMSKELGKNNVQFFHKDLKNEILTKISLETKIIKALQEDQFYLMYQPIFSRTNKKIASFEALARWETKEGKKVPPDVFIPIAEEVGIIHELGYWVIKRVCEMAKKVNETYHNQVAFAINVSAIQIRNKDFVNNFKKIVQDASVNPELIEVEITESVFINNKEVAVEMLRELKSFGVKVSLDDFGTGYSSLSYLLELPIDKLKIDRSFVSNIGLNKKKGEMVASIINMAQRLEMKVVAEGIETPQQFEYLDKADCDYFQGFLLGRPMETDKAIEILKEN